MIKQKLSTGYIHVYTGNGKGKTTAALGAAFRAMGHGLRIYIGQFMKGLPYGELKTAQLFNDQLVIEQYGKPTFVHVDQATEEDIQMAEKGLSRLKKAINSGNFDIIIMDEVNVALHFQLISETDVIEIIKNKPKHVEIICTGRYAPTKLIELADLVTEMTEVKHYFSRGVQARDGIER